MLCNAPVLTVQDLAASFKIDEGLVRAVQGVSFSIEKGKTLGLVGESGSGKSTVALSIMRLLPKPSGTIKSGRILFDGRDLVTLPPDSMRNIRGKRIAMIFQEPMTALNPVYTIGDQLVEMLALHHHEMTRSSLLEACLELLKKVGISEPQRRMHDYPHQMSGGMRQRVMIAMALTCKPDILIADEPTTALDVTIQAQILDLMRKLQDEYGMAIIFITHDFGVVAEMCHDVAVMYGGMIVEEAPVNDLFKCPRHPYTKGLLESMPCLSTRRKAPLPVIKGKVSSLLEIPTGCNFENRCSLAGDQCRRKVPEMDSVSEGHRVRCFRWREV